MRGKDHAKARGLVVPFAQAGEAKIAVEALPIAFEIRVPVDGDLRKLRQLQIAGRLADLRVPPGNRLEKLRGDRAGRYRIRVNDPFRVCFRWSAAGAADVEIVDYH